MSDTTSQLHFPPNRLAELLARAHGRSRQEAIQGGTMALESQRPAAMAALETLIAGLEAGPLTRSRMTKIARDADRIVTLSLYFGLFPLADAARRLWDVTVLLEGRGAFDAAALDVQIRALRLFAPGSPLLDDAQAAMVLGRIAALAAHVSHHCDGHLPGR